MAYSGRGGCFFFREGKGKCEEIVVDVQFTWLKSVFCARGFHCVCVSQSVSAARLAKRSHTAKEEGKQVRRKESKILKCSLNPTPHTHTTGSVLIVPRAVSEKKVV